MNKAVKNRSPEFKADAARLRELWEKKPSENLYGTALRLGLSPSKAEALVVGLVADGVVVYEGEPFSAKFV